MTRLIAMRWLLTALMIPALAVAQDVTDYRAGEGLSTPQKRARAAEAVKHIQGVLVFAIEREREAEAKADIIQINCVKEVIGDVRAQVFIAQNSLKDFESAVQASEAESANYQFTKITVAEMTANRFRAQIEACVGEASSYTGETVVDVQVDDDIRQDDASVEQDGSPFQPVDATRPEALTGSQ